MAEAAIAAEVHQTLDVHIDLTAEITFDLIVQVDGFTDLPDLILIEIVRELILGDAGNAADLGRAMRTDTENILKRNHDVLSPGDIYTSDSCHIEPLALPLLMTGVLTKHAHHTLAAHDLALFADFLDAGPNFHRMPCISTGSAG